MSTGGGRSVPRAMQLFASCAATLTWSRALLKAVVEELYPDDPFSELVGNLGRIPSRHWPRVIAIAVALRRGWRQDQLTRLAQRLRLSLAKSETVRDHVENSPNHHDAHSLARLGPVKALRFASTPRGGACGLDRGARSSHVWAFT